MNDYLNQLKALMDFYDTTGAGGPREGNGYDMGMNAANYAGNRLRFAQQMMGQMQGPQMGNLGYQSMPNFFNFAPQQPTQTPGAVPMSALDHPPVFRNSLSSLVR